MSVVGCEMLGNPGVQEFAWKFKNTEFEVIMVIVVVDIVVAVVGSVFVVSSVVVVKNTEFEVKGVLSSVLL